MQSSNRLENFPISFFAVIMGLSGLTISWEKAAPMFQLGFSPANTLLWLTTAVLILLATLYSTKVIRFQDQVVAELKHPVLLNFFPVISISLLLTQVRRFARLQFFLSWWAYSFPFAAITIATLARFAPVAPGDTIATIKIIPLAVPEVTVQAVIKALDCANAVSVLPIEQKQIGLILTRVAGGRERLLDKAANVLRARLEHLGLVLTEEMSCGHNQAEVAAAIAELDRRSMDMIIVAGAAATIDRGDVVPAGIERAGGRIEQFGMPVEPGNLLVLGELGGKSVIGMPGCARSPRLNGFDWVLQRLLAGVPVGAGDLRAMGVGGLIAEKARGGARSEKQMAAEIAGPTVTAPPPQP